jgi:hypothetical protein
MLHLIVPVKAAVAEPANIDKIPGPGKTRPRYFITSNLVFPHKEDTLTISSQE